jgi:electron transfer flavoprotein alpha subunit
MASIVAFVEVRRGATTVPSRHAVAEARRVASELGATVYALLVTGAIDDATIEAHSRALGEIGADRILCCADCALEGPLLDASGGGLLATVGARLRPVLTLFPAGRVGAALGPPLAMRLGGVFHERAALELTGDDTGKRLVVRRFRPADAATRSLVVGEPGRPIVATLAAGPEPHLHGEAANEVEMLAYVSAPSRPAPGRPPREIEAEPDDGEALELATSLLVAGGDVQAADLEALREAAPSGTVVVRQGEQAPGLDAACAGRLLVVGKGVGAAALRGAISPATQVAVAGGKGAEKDLGRVDVIWRPAARQPLGALATALGKNSGERR